jgi:uncharacterized membrane protein
MCPALHLYVLFITDQYQKQILGRLYWSVNAVIAGYNYVDVESITPTALAISLYWILLAIAHNVLMLSF